ncbi:MAG: SpaA isopeptide-forming pilin-related protein [Hespellia sp.]|nr:SpaA isopeptide-forming pilin-related protein [Hespellia sp.]
MKVKNTGLRKKVMEMLAVLVGFILVSCSVDTALAKEGEKEQNITFFVEGAGQVQLQFWDGSEVSVADSESLSLPVGTYVHMVAESEAEGGIGVSVSTSGGYEAEDSVWNADSIHEQDITITEYEKHVLVQFQAADKTEATTFALSARGSEERPETGDRFSGTCQVSYVNQTHVGGSVSSVQVNSLSGILSEIGTLDGLTCQQHSAAAPLVGMGYDYTYTVTSVNKSTGEVSGVFYAKSQIQPSDGVTVVNGALAGYQAIGGSATIQRSYTGFAKLVKRSANPELTEGNSSYSLAGAVYGIYSDPGCSTQVNVLTTDAGGNTNTVEVPSGIYYVKEKTAPKGYRIDDTVYPVNVQVEQTVTVDVNETPGYIPAEILLDKADQEAGNIAQGKATLSGAQFAVRFYEGYYTADTLPADAAREWVLETKETLEDESGKIRYRCRLSKEYQVAGDDFYVADDCCILPLGTLTIEEIKAPEGYNLAGESEKYVTQITMEDQIVQIAAGNHYIVSDRVIRGDIEFTKADERTQARMAGIPFKITSRTTGESHEIMTDENGYFSSDSAYVKHSKNTNGKKVGDGVWFGIDENGKQTEVNDETGAFPYDTYLIEELACEANEGKELYSGNVTITREHFLLDMGTIDNYNEEKPQKIEQPKKEAPEKTEENRPGIVKTGDEVTLVCWIVLGLLTMCGGILTFLYKSCRR